MYTIRLWKLCMITLLVLMMSTGASSLYASEELGESEWVPISDPQTDETKMSGNPGMYATEEERNATDTIPWVPECGAGGMFEDEDPPFATSVEIYDGSTGEISIEEQDTELDEAIESLEPRFSEGNSGLSLDTISPECVIGSDGRTKVSSTDSYPWRAQVKLKVKFGSTWYNCSGTMIGAYQLLTAGHCVHQGSGGNWFNEIKIYPGYECGHKQWWLADYTLVRSYSGWTVSGSANHDWAMITLDRRIGSRTGWFGYLTAGCSWYDGKGFNIAGYPVDLDGGECQYYDFDYERDCSDYKLYYYIDTYGGQSGSATYWLDGSSRYEVAVHAYGHTSGGSCVYNSGTRLNQDKYDRIGTWKSDDDANRPPTDKAELMDDGEVYAHFSPITVDLGESFSAWSDIRNVGTASASNIPVSYYASTNNICSTGDYLIGTANVSYLSAITPTSWANADWNGTFPTSIPLGTYYLCRIIDPYNTIPEFNDPGAGNAQYDDTMLTVTDTNPPTPNPMTWSTVPYETSTSSISMVATTASDPTPPITYYFDFYSSPTGGSGGNDSSWQSSTSYTDSALGTNHEYGYRVRARDGSDNQTSYSSVSYDYTDIQTPTGITFGTITSTSIQARSTNTPSGLTRGSSGLYIYNATAGTNSGWKQNNDYWTNTPLSPNTQYGFRARARNGDANTTPYCATSYRYTLANLPGASSFSNVTQTSIRANWTANGNPSGTEYYCENTSTVTNSGWTTNTYWNSAGLTCGTFYTFRVKARNGDGTQTGWTNLGSQSTQPCLPTVTTTAVSSITSNSASSGGNITSDGGASVTARGVCWSTSANPTTSDSHTSDGTGTGSFTSSITGLSPNTPYHVRAYATNSEGTGYGSDQTFTTKGEGGKAMPWLHLLLLGD